MATSVEPTIAQRQDGRAFQDEGTPRTVVRTLILQPGTLCNADCSYCSIPLRKTTRFMTPEVALHIADGVGRLPLDGGRPINAVWHCGEPTAVGLKRFEALLVPFAPLVRAGTLSHGIQTNATLLDERWCDLFAEYGFAIGVSIDGPPEATAQRVDWAEAPLYPRILRGIEQLRKHHLSFSVIAVVGADWLDKAATLYTFFKELGCHTLGINVEEWQGLDRPRIDDERVTRFWEDLWDAWQSSPGPAIREFNRATSYLDAVCTGLTCPERPLQDHTIDLIPTVSWDGDVVTLSPDFLGVSSPYHDDFVVGNVRNTPFDEILRNASNASYVRDYVAGVIKLADRCPYFSFCCGGLASAKFFEGGDTGGGCTAHCRNGSARLIKGVLNRL